MVTVAVADAALLGRTTGQQMLLTPGPLKGSSMDRKEVLVCCRLEI
jgi:hypothetical protein